ncbi:MAG TPA: hypothetical protein VH396_09540 [Chitinophagaceae bacterium]|jgi:hypothetical protein
MAKKKVTDKNLKHVEKENAGNKDFKVREGQEDSSVWGDKEKPNEDAYPRLNESDKQYKKQPEFTESKSNKSKEA